MTTHTLAAGLMQALRIHYPDVWGAHKPQPVPRHTRKYIAGVQVFDTAPRTTPGAVQSAPTTAAETLAELEIKMRALPRVFVEDDIPGSLCAALPMMERMGIIKCVSRKRAEVKQYIRVGA